MNQVTEEEARASMLKLSANSFPMLPLILMASSVCAYLLTDYSKNLVKTLFWGAPFN